MSSQKPDNSNDVDRVIQQRATATISGEFSKEIQGYDSHSAVERVLSDMNARWEAGERPLAEQYLARLPAEIDADLAVDVIYNEFLLRQSLGEPTSTETFLARFPEHYDVLKRQLSLDAALTPTFDFGSTDTASHAPTSQHPLLADKTFPVALGKYLLVAPLDAGGQAEVFLALHPGLHKEVVVKLSRFRLDRQSHFAARMLDEGRILARLEHPSLGKVYDVDTYQNYPFMVMEYVRGVPMNQYRRQTRLTARQAATIVAHLARGVAHAHREQVVHRDIKPKNVLVDSQGVPRLIDFGLASLQDGWSSSAEETHISGTLEFMAPEQVLRGEKQVGKGADIYALGGVLYYLLTGEVPHQGQTEEQLLKSIINNEWNRPALVQRPIPPALRRICSKAMATAAEDRYLTADAFASDLEHFAGNRNRRQVLIATAGLFMVLLLTGSATFFYPSRTLPPLSTPALSIYTWQGDHFVPLQEQLPLQRGDELQFRGNVPANCNAALLHYDSKGKWQCLKQWPARNQPTSVVFPEVGQAVPLAGAAGTEFVVLCISREVFSLEDVRDATSEGEPLAQLPAYVVGYMDQEKGVRTESLGRGFGAPVARENPEDVLHDQLSQIAHALDSKALKYCGIAFFHK